MKLKYKDIPEIKSKLMLRQKDLCAICERPLSAMKSRDICLDHNHKTGKIRAVLCRGCNSMEGKVHRAFVRVGLQNQGVDYKMFLAGLMDYTRVKDTKYIHPKFKEKNVKTK